MNLKKEKAFVRQLMKKRIFFYVLGIAVLLLLISIYLIHADGEWRILHEKKVKKCQKNGLNLETQKKSKEKMPSLIAETLNKYEEHLKKNPEDIQTHLSLGQICLTIASRQEQAGRHLSKVLELSPSHHQKEKIQEWLKKLKQKENRKKREETIRKR